MTDHEAKAREIVSKSAFGMLDSRLIVDDLNSLVSAVASALREAEEREREACAKIAKETAESAEDGYKINHCEHCRDGEIASHNVGYFIVKAILNRGNDE